MQFNGHLIDPDQVDRFVDGLTGEPITDEAWDEQQRRLRGEVPPLTRPGEEATKYLTDDEYRAAKP